MSTDLLQTLVMIVSACVAIWAVYVAHRANGKSDEGHTLARKGNCVSEDSNRIAQDALRQATEANQIATHANRLAEVSAKQERERLTENAHPLLTITYDGKAREFVIKNRSVDTAYNLKIEFHGPVLKHIYAVEKTLKKGAPVRVPLRRIFDLWVTEGAPPERGAREYRYDVILHYTTEKGNVRSEETDPFVYQSVSGYPG